MSVCVCVCVCMCVCVCVCVCVRERERERERATTLGEKRACSQPQTAAHLFDESDKHNLPGWLHILHQNLIPGQALQDGAHLPAQLERVELHLQTCVQLQQLWWHVLQYVMATLQSRERERETATNEF